MSLFSWFNRKPPAPRQRPAVEPSGLLNADATVPLVPGRGPGKPMPEPPAEHAANRKNERMERRELLYTVVRDAMVRAGVLSAGYKFKVLSLDQRGRQFLVMMDLAREYGGETIRLSEIEALIAQTAKTRFDILVTAVYWRINDHVAVGMPSKGLAPHGVAGPSVPHVPAAPLARPPAPVHAPRPCSPGTPAHRSIAGAAQRAPGAPSAAGPRPSQNVRPDRSRRSGSVQAGAGPCRRGQAPCTGTAHGGVHALRPAAALDPHRLRRHGNAGQRRPLARPEQHAVRRFALNHAGGGVGLAPVASQPPPRAGLQRISTRRAGSGHR
nr:hypothetical protein [Acidovorax sp. NCPPB 3576]